GGRVEFSVELNSVPQHLWVKVTDKGPGDEDPGVAVATTGRLMDLFEVDSRPGEGTTIRIAKVLPEGTVTRSELHDIVSGLARERIPGAYDEVRRQNQELLETLNALRSRENDLAEQRQRVQQL